MFSNVGTTDRVARLVLGSILLYLGLGLFPGSALGIGLIIAGAIASLTGLFGFCGLYQLLGINTRKTDPTP